jgi:serine/threonine protein kinase
MATNLETVVKQLTDSGIVAPGKLEKFVLPQADPKTANELVAALVKQKHLTPFQAQHVKAGKAKALILGNYTVLDMIGAGGMGQVFKAEHRRMERIVAIKMLPPAMTKNATALARFQREVKAAAKLRHPHIVAADDADEANGSHFLVMEYVEGRDLSAHVKKNGPFSVEKAVNYILQAARGLEFAHSEGVVHRDIKPANLLLDKKGVVKILDMGLARIDVAGGDVAAQSELTGTGAIMGTVDYMAPEQGVSTHGVDARADIYSLGCTLHYLLIGKPVYGGETAMAKLLAHHHHLIPDLGALREEVPEQVNAIFRKLVAKEVEDRYQTMTEVIADLQSCSVGHDQSLSMQRSISIDSKNCAVTFENVSLDTTQKPLVKSSHASNKNVLIYGAIGAGLLGALIVAALIFSLRTKNGTLIVKVDQPDAVVTVSNEAGKVEMSEPAGPNPISISVVPGNHRVRVQKDGFVVVTENVDIQSDGKQSITAQLVPVKVVAKASPPNKPDPASRPAPAEGAVAKSLPSTTTPPLAPSPATVDPPKPIVPTTMPAPAPVTSVAPPVATPAETTPAPVEIAKVEPPVKVPPVEIPVKTPLTTATSPANTAPASTNPASAPVEKVEPSKSKDSRLPIPNTDARLQAEQLLRELMKSDLASAKLPEQKSALIEKLFKHADATKDDPASKYVMLEEALRLAIDIADVTALDKVINALTTTYVSDANDMWIEALEKAAQKSRSPQISKSLAEAALARIEALVDRDDYELAKRYQSVASAAAQKARDLALTKLVVEQGKSLTAANKQWDAMEKTKADLLANPDDATANLALGKYSCFIKGQWEQGFKYLAKGNDSTLADLATRSLLKPGEPAARVALGDAWWKASESAKGANKADLQIGGGYWYAVALPGLTGLEKNRVEQRIQALPAKTAKALITSGTDVWLKQIAALPAEKQLEAVTKRLAALNPGFTSSVTFRIEGGVVTEFNIDVKEGKFLTDISPVRALQGLKVFRCQDGKLSDLSQLRGMKLEILALRGCIGVQDISPLEGMKITTLDLGGTKVSDLSPLQGMPLNSLSFYGCSTVKDLSPLRGMKITNLTLRGCPRVSDIEPLRGMPLTALSLGSQEIQDFSPLQDMKLTRLELSGCIQFQNLELLQGMKLNSLSIDGVGPTDLNPLREMPLDAIWLTPKNIITGMDVLRNMKSLRTIGIDTRRWPPAEFWARYDKGEFR